MPGFRIEQDPLPMICVKRDLRHIQPEVTSFALVRQTAQGFRCTPSLLPEMSAEPDREEIPSRGAFRHMEFPRDDGGISHLLVIEHPVGGPAFRLSAGPVRQQDHPPERFRPRHIVLFSRKRNSVPPRGGSDPFRCLDPIRFPRCIHS